MARPLLLVLVLLVLVLACVITCINGYQLGPGGRTYIQPIVSGKPPAPIVTGDDALYKVFLRRAKKDHKSKQAMEDIKDAVSEAVVDHCDKWHADVLEDLAGPMYEQLDGDKEQVDELKSKGVKTIGAESQTWMCSTWQRLMPGLTHPTTTVLKALAELNGLRVVVMTFENHDRTGGIVDALDANPSINSYWSMKELQIDCFLDGPKGCQVQFYGIPIVGESDKRLLVEYIRREKTHQQQPPSFGGANAFFKAVAILHLKKQVLNNKEFRKYLHDNKPDVGSKDVTAVKEGLGGTVVEECSHLYPSVLEDLAGPMYEQLDGDKEQVDELKSKDVKTIGAESQTWMCSTWQRLMPGLTHPTTTVLKALAEWKRSQVVVTSFDDSKTFSGAHVERVDHLNFRIDRGSYEYAIYHFKEGDRYQPIDKFRIA